MVYIYVVIYIRFKCTFIWDKHNFKFSIILHEYQYKFVCKSSIINGKALLS